MTGFECATGFLGLLDEDQTELALNKCENETFGDNRLSAKEAMAKTKEGYKETLKYLGEMKG